MRNYGKRIPREIYDDSNTPLQAYKNLFSAVLVQALRDAFMNLPKSEGAARAAEVHMRQARAWFEAGEDTAESDFAAVCLAAGFEPDYILRVYRALKSCDDNRKRHLRLTQFVKEISKDTQ